MRKITQHYEDPASLVWRHAAERMGMRVVRSAEVNASWDGAGTLTVGTPDTLDPDDCLPQMILHETCHALCDGPESLGKLDWGLSNEPDAKVHEHACLRLQAALADQHGMRAFFAATPVFRAYYDALPPSPLAECDDPAVTLARAGWERAQHGPWAEPLADALRRTAHLADAVRDIAPPGSLWRGSPGV